MKRWVYILFKFLFLQVFYPAAQCPLKENIRPFILQKEITKGETALKKLELSLGYLGKFEKCGFAKDSTYAWLLQNIGWQYTDQGNFSQAADYFLQSIEINKRNGAQGKSDYNIINGYYWLSTLYDSLKNEPEKRKAIDSCISFSVRLNNVTNASAIRCLLDRVQYFYDIGEYKLCINDAQICERAAREYERISKMPGDIVLGKFSALSSFHWHINALFRLQDFDEAAKLLINKEEEYRKNGPRNYLALTYSQLAEMHVMKNEYDQALINYETALRVYLTDKDNFNAKQTLNSIGENIYFKHLNEYDKALTCFRKALEYKNNSPYYYKREDSIESLSIFGRIANVYIQKGIFDSAFFYFQKAFDQVRKGATIHDILYSAPDEFVRYKKIDYLVDLITSYADAYRSKYEITKRSEDLFETISLYTKADKFMARLNVSQFEQGSKLVWRNEARRLYEKAIEACYRTQNVEKAFYFFERSRAVLLNIQLTEKNLINSKDIYQQDEIKKRIVFLTGLINNLPDSAKKKRVLQDSIQMENDRLYNAAQAIRAKYPLYFQNLDTALLSISDVRNKLLAQYDCVFMMFSGDNAIYTLTITSKESFINKIDKTDFEHSVSIYTSFISNYELLNKDFAGYKEVARHLYYLLFDENKPPGGRVIISPDSYYFPFESLITLDASPMPEYFIMTHAVGYTYSIRYLFHNLNSSAPVAAGNFLGIAPLHFSSSHNLTDLSGSDISLKNIQSSIGGSDIFISSDATKGNFLQRFGGYKILQLYTHASGSSDRKEPVIYFSDSALYMSELISALHPATELIILSACETGNGQLYQGEGVFSLNRAFAALGIPSSITNLWTIDNKSTYRLTELFYKYVGKGLPLDVALQRAKTEFIKASSKEKQLPYYWAAAILVGNTEAISIDKNNNWIAYAIRLGIPVFLFILFILYKQKRKFIPTPGKAETAS